MTTDSRARAGLSSGAAGLDLVFIFDSSASVGTHNFRKGIDFAKMILDEFGISDSPTGTRVAVVVFSSDAQVVYNLQTNRMPSKEQGIQKLGEPFDGLATTLLKHPRSSTFVADTSSIGEGSFVSDAPCRSRSSKVNKQNPTNQLQQINGHREICVRGITTSLRLPRKLQSWPKVVGMMVSGYDFHELLFYLKVTFALRPAMMPSPASESMLV